MLLQFAAQMQLAAPHSPPSRHCSARCPSVLSFSLGRASDSGLCGHLTFFRGKDYRRVQTSNCSFVSSSDPMVQTRRRGPEYDLLRRVSTAPAEWSMAEAASNPVTPSGTPRAGMRHPLGSPAIAKVPAGGYMPSPRRRGSIAGPGSLLRQSPRLARWTIEELPSGFENARRHREPPAATIDGAISNAHLHGEGRARSAASLCAQSDLWYRCMHS